jgi:hypothetical protein
VDANRTQYLGKFGALLICQGRRGVDDLPDVRGGLGGPQVALGVDQLGTLGGTFTGADGALETGDAGAVVSSFG